jgi:hypothetical protein
LVDESHFSTRRATSRLHDFEIISTNLPAEEEQMLREAFGEEPSDVSAER